MKLNTLVFLPSKDACVEILKRIKTKNVAMTFRDDGEIAVLNCEFDSEDGYYLSVKIPHPIDGHPKCVAKLAIPHASVLMFVQSDWKTHLGFLGKV
jgi:hypothetical protein